MGPVPASNVARVAGCLFLLGAPLLAQRVDDAEAARRERFAPRDAGPVLTDLTLLHLGSRGYSEGYMDDAVGSDGVLGIEYAGRDQATGLGFEGGLFLSSPDGVALVDGERIELDVDLYELYGGGRYTHRLGRGSLYAYVGTGLDLYLGDGELLRTSSGVTRRDGIDALGYGGYVHGGLYFVGPEGWVLGVDLRQSVGVELRSDAWSWHANHSQLGLFLGIGF